MRLLAQIGLVSLGSALGGLARWGVSVGVGWLFDTAFPWGTFLINITGSLFLGWFSAVLAERFVAREGGWLQADDLRLLVAVGFTGAYTTFSTFEYEAHSLLRDGESWLATIYICASVLVGLVGVRLGVALGRA